MGDDKGKSKGCLVGCLVVVGICFLIVFIIALVVIFKGEDIVRGVLHKAKDGTEYLLTEDHTDEERQIFVQNFSLFIDELNTGDLRENIRNNGELITELSKMVEDQRINRQESREWLTLYLASRDNVLPQEESP